MDLIVCYKTIEDYYNKENKVYLNKDSIVYYKSLQHVFYPTINGMIKTNNNEYFFVEFNIDVNLKLSGISLTNDEKIILKNINFKYKWLARDKDDRLMVYENKPKRMGNLWNANKGDFIQLDIFPDLFKSITWDDEPYLIERYKTYFLEV